MEKGKSVKRDKSRYAILGILQQEPMSGYEMGRMMAQSTNHFWQESDASIYPMLKTLEAEGKVTARAERTGKRARTIFEITPTGTEEFMQWMAEPPAQEKHRNELLLKIFFGSKTTNKDLLKHLERALKNAKTEKKEFEASQASIIRHFPDDHPHKAYWSMTLRAGFLSADADIMWINECINVLKGK